MPYIETPDELADLLADVLGIYGAHDDNCGAVQAILSLEPKSIIAQTRGEWRSLCRVCFVPYMSDRITKSVENYKNLYPDGGNCRVAAPSEAESSKNESDLGKIRSTESLIKDSSNVSNVMIGTKAFHQWGEISRSEPDYFVVDDEDPLHWIGHWLEGLGLCNVLFPKESCRPLTDEEKTTLERKLKNGFRITDAAFSTRTD